MPIGCGSDHGHNHNLSYNHYQTHTHNCTSILGLTLIITLALPRASLTPLLQGEGLPRRAITGQIKYPDSHPPRLQAQP